jgi:hemerythrin-like domain-containing protein
VLRERAGNGAAPPLDEPPLRALMGLLEAQFATHMRDEEELLFPALAEALPETAPSLVPLRKEHGELRQMLAAITAALGQPASPSRDEQIMVQLRDFVDLLRIHVHKEEAAVFSVAGRVLAPLEITALSRRVAERRERRQGSPSRRTPS